MMKPLLFVVLSVVLWGCRGAENGGKEARAPLSFSYDAAVPLPDGRVLNDAEALAEPADLRRVGPYLVVADAYGSPPVHVIDARDGGYVDSLGTQGEGPGEFRRVWSFDTAPGSPECWIYDIRLLRLTHVNLTAYLEDRSLRGARQVVPAGGGLPTSPFWVNDTLLVSPGLIGGGRFARYDARGRLIDVVGEMPVAPEGIAPPLWMNAVRGEARPRPDRSRIALVMNHADRLQIYSPSGRLLAEAVGPEGYPPAPPGNDQRNAYIDLAATPSFIFGLYSGAPSGEEDSNFGTLVHVFDWDANFLAAFRLDAPALGIEADEEAGVLYATRHAPSVAVVEYAVDLPGSAAGGR